MMIMFVAVNQTYEKWWTIVHNPGEVVNLDDKYVSNFFL